jgi:hypothetical protein
VETDVSEEKRYSLINVRMPKGVMERVATALERIVSILEVVYHDEITPREPPPKVKPGRLFVQTPDHLVEVQEEARRRGQDSEPEYDDRVGHGEAHDT